MKNAAVPAAADPAEPVEGQRLRDERGDGGDQPDGQHRTAGRVARDAEGGRRDRRAPRPAGVRRSSSRAGRAPASRTKPEAAGGRDAQGHAGDDPGGGHHRLDQAGAGGEVEAGERVLHRTHQPDAGEQQDDVGGDDERGVDLDRGGRHGSGQQRGDRAARHLVVEERQPAPGHQDLHPVDERRRDGRDRATPRARRRGRRRPRRPSRPTRWSPPSAGRRGRARRSSPSATRAR